MLAEEVVVEAYQFHLSEGGEKLALLHGIQVMVHLQFAPSAGHGSR